MQSGQQSGSDAHQMQPSSLRAAFSASNLIVRTAFGGGNNGSEPDFQIPLLAPHDGKNVTPNDADSEMWPLFRITQLYVGIFGTGDYLSPPLYVSIGEGPM